MTFFSPSSVRSYVQNSSPSDARGLGPSYPRRLCERQGEQLPGCFVHRGNIDRDGLPARQAGRSVERCFTPSKSRTFTARATSTRPAINSSTDVDVTFRATRGPNGGGANYKVPYFVSISQADRILAKKVYSIDFAFAPGETTTTFTDTVKSADVAAAKDKKTFDYIVLVGLQLTKEQLDFNRASGRLTP